MSYRARAGEQPVKPEPGEDESAVPPAQSQIEVDQRPAIIPADVDDVVEDDGSGMAGGASGTSAGGSSTPGHPDAAQPEVRGQQPSGPAT
jgi:hypothetical protein